MGAAAARINDPIGHTPAMRGLLGGLLAGVVVGAAIAAIGIATVGTGGLMAVAIVGAGAAMGGGLGEAFSGLSFVPKQVAGKIAGVCSKNVFTNGLAAARAHLDRITCDKHPSPPAPIASGSGTVFINSMPAARVDDKTGCGGDITEGSSNVFIGGGTVQTDPIHPENLVPDWVHYSLMVVGLGAGIVIAGPVIAVGGFIVGYGGGYAGSWVGGKIFGQGSDGQIYSAILGSFAGGWLGAKKAPNVWNFAKRIEVKPIPGALGANGGNIRVSLKPKPPVLPPKPVVPPKTLADLVPNGKIPGTRNGEFNEWYNGLSPEEFNTVWQNPQYRDIIMARIRSPGGLHEWLLVSQTDKFKAWGVSMEDIKAMRTLTKDVDGSNPPWSHGGTGSTKAHNELIKLIEESNSFAQYKAKLQIWADNRLVGGRDALPEGLRD